MEKKTVEKKIEKETKPSKTLSTQNLRVDKIFVKKLQRIVEKANKKEFGARITPKDVLAQFLELSDTKLIERVIRKVQDDSLSHDDKKKLFIKSNATKFGGSKEKLEQKMMELMEGFLTQEIKV